jgi:hypothetical protein
VSERIQDLYDEKEFEELLESARMNAANDWEESFVSDINTRFYQYGRRMYISEAQQTTLERIANDD